MFYYLIFYALLCCNLQPIVHNFEQTWPAEISIGLLNSGDAELDVLIAKETLVDLKNDQFLPKSVSLRTEQMSACDDSSAVNASIQLWLKYNVSVILGPECSDGMIAMGVVAASLNKAVIAYGSVVSIQGNQTKFPTMVRNFNGMSYGTNALGLILTYYNWSTISIVQNGANCEAQLFFMAEEFSKRNITLMNNIYIDYNVKSAIENAIFLLKITSRVILLCNGNSPSSVLNFLLAADKADMNTPDYVFITPYFFQESFSDWEPWLQKNVTPDYATAARKAYKNTIVVYVLMVSTNDKNSMFNNFSSRIENIVNANPQIYPTKFNPDYMISLGSLRDSIYLYGAVLNKSISMGIDYKDGVNFVAAFQNTVLLNGVNGKIVIDSTNKKVPAYIVSKMDQNGEYSSFMNIADNNSDTTFTLQILPNLKTPIWNTDNGLPPPAIPLCGFQYENCQKNYTLELSIGLPVGLIGISCLALIMYIYYRKYNFEKQLLEMNWRIDLRQFHYNTRQAIQETVSSGSGSNIRSLNVDRAVSLSGSQGTNSSAEKFANTGVYRDNTVFVKKYHRVARFNIDRDILLRLKLMKEMNHDNINKFVGFSTETDNSVIFLFDYCAKRSLLDIVYNEDIHLDTVFQGSILRDIISGLEYLHTSPIGHHGRLFASNCVVDNRWIVKLTDFGLQTIVNHMKQEKILLTSDELDMNKLLCTAPEVLRFPSLIDLKPADVYQFGMILYQLMFREPPFSDSHLTAAEIVISLKRETANSVVLRPALKHTENVDSGFQTLMINCWREDVTMRPTLSELKKEIFSSTKKFGKNLMDHVMSMLEKYATNLEKVVEERTGQLNEEKNRADRLLYQMLPRTVADALKTGHSVHPESYDCVTVYFSDIVGFTAICSKSKPVEIVLMLNTLYSQFDAVIMKCDAFKVETIGDAYLVVSGLPVRNGTKHVAVVADMSLDISAAINKYKIPHLPESSMQLRIGIHSGPVAAGVVGLTMPKYCLFGDSVNFASRMESTGEAGKIHITEFTKRMLDKYSNYVTVLRGDIEVKGKGLCTTYWLVDKIK